MNGCVKYINTLSQGRVDWPTLDAVCALVGEGKTLISVVGRFTGLTTDMVHAWCRMDSEAAIRYARARESRADAMFDELLTITDEEPPTVEGRVDSGWVQWQRNRVDTRKFAVAKLAPKKYGDKLEVEHSGAVATVTPADVAAALTLSPLLQALATAPAVVEVPCSTYPATEEGLSQ